MIINFKSLKEFFFLSEICKKYVLPSFEECRMRRSRGMAHRFGYLQCMCLSGVSIKTLLLIVIEEFASKAKSRFQIYRKFYWKFYRKFYRNLLKFYKNFTENFTVFIFGCVFLSVKNSAKFSVK